MPVSVSVYTGHTLQCTLSGCGGLMANPVYSYTGATLGPLQCIHSVHCQCTSSVYTGYTELGSGTSVNHHQHWGYVHESELLSCY